MSLGWETSLRVPVSLSAAPPQGAEVSRLFGAGHGQSPPCIMMLDVASLVKFKVEVCSRRLSGASWDPSPYMTVGHIDFWKEAHPKAVMVTSCRHLLYKEATEAWPSLWGYYFF